MFKWRNNGRRSLTKQKQQVGYRIHYVYTLAPVCFAQYKKTIRNGKKDKKCKGRSHNHLPPSLKTLPLKKKKREKICQQVDVGASLITIHTKSVNEALLPLSGRDVPSMSQLKNIKYSSKKNLAGIINLLFLSLLYVLSYSSTSDVFDNIHSNHASFTQSVGFVNRDTFLVVFASDIGLKILVRSLFVVVNETHSTTECKLTLTTILADHDSVMVSCTYMLSSSKEAKTYKKFFEVAPISLIFFQSELIVNITK
jgi:hypothetical protein